MRRYRDVSGAEGVAIVWERLEHYELKRRERGIGRDPRPARRAWCSSVTHPPGHRAERLRPTGIAAAGLATGLGSAAGALLLASFALYWQRLPLLRRGFEPGTGLVRTIRRFPNGVVNGYVTWIVIGVACVGGTLAFSIR